MYIDADTVFKAVFLPGALAAGIALGLTYSAAAVRRQRRQRKKPRAGILRSVTRLIFVTTQVSALMWVFTSYGIAIYSAVRLEQVYTMAELSEPAIHTILGVGVLKVLENIFEHNEGAVFGRSRTEDDPPAGSGEEGGAG